jgi:hypothetical protein
MRRLTGFAAGFTYLFAASVLVVGTGVRATPLAEPTAKLLASDGAKSDQFGSSVAIDGSVALVGAEGTKISAKIPARIPVRPMSSVSMV